MDNLSDADVAERWVANALREHLVEFGFVFRPGAVGVHEAIAFLPSPSEALPEHAH